MKIFLFSDAGSITCMVVLLEVPPPGEGLTTVTELVEAEDGTIPLLTVATICVLVIVVGLIVFEPHFTVEREVKPEPLMVMVKDCEVKVKGGKTEVTLGSGLVRTGKLTGEEVASPGLVMVTG